LEAGNSGNILRSTDNGTTWESISGTSQHLWGAGFYE